MRRLIATITAVATLSAPLAAEASPWGWVKHNATRIEEGVVGTASVIAGVAGYAAAGNLVMGALAATEIAGGTFALTMGIGALLPIAAGALIGLGVYEIYQALEGGSGTKGTDVRRNAETRALPQDRPLAPATQNAGMHH